MPMNQQEFRAYVKVLIQEELAELVGVAVSQMEARFSEMLDQYSTYAMAEGVSRDFENRMGQAWEAMVMAEAERIEERMVAEQTEGFVQALGEVIDENMSDQTHEQPVGKPVAPVKKLAAVPTPDPVVFDVEPGQFDVRDEDEVT